MEAIKLPRTYTEDEIAEIRNAAYKQGVDTEFERLEKLHAEHMELIEGKLEGKKGGKRGKKEPAKPAREARVFTALELGQMNLPDPKWIVEDVLPEGSSILAAAPKIGKSRLMLDIAHALARGGYALGKVQVKQRGVLYLALEGSTKGIQSYLKQLSYGEDLPANLHIARDWPGMDEGGVEKLHEWIDQHDDTGLIIIDTIKAFKGKARGGNVNMYDLDYEMMSPISRLTIDKGVDVVAIHHTNKGDSEDHLVNVSGSYGLTGAVDSVMSLTRQRGQIDAKLIVTPRDLEEKEHALSFKEGQWILEGDAAQYALTRERQEIIDLIQERKRFMGATEIANALGKGRAAVQRLLGKMWETERMLENRNGKYGLHPLKYPRWEPIEDSGNSSSTGN